MSRALTASQLLSQLDRWHVDYTPLTRGGVPWHRHHRPPSTGGWGDMHGVLNHHTGRFSTVAGMLALLWEGRSDLPGPLCQVSTAPDGTLFLVGWGRANHAGSGARNVYDALLADRNPPRPGADTVDGNALLYGNEVMHPGDRSPYPDVQIATAVRFNAAVLEGHGWSASSAIQHEEWTRRKIDMSWRDPHTGRDFRAEVARALELGPDRYTFGATPNPPEDDMPSPQDYARAVVETRATVLNRSTGHKRSVGVTLTDLEATQEQMLKEVRASRAVAEKLTDLVAAQSGVSPDEFRAILREEVVKVEVSVRTSDDEGEEQP